MREEQFVQGNTFEDLVIKQVSHREMQIIESLVVGMTARELAAELGISFHTVRTHIRNIYSKLEVANRIELARWVQEHCSLRVERTTYEPLAAT